MNPKQFSTGALIALIILVAVNTVSAVDVPFLDPFELGDGTPSPYGSIVADIDADGDNDIIAIANVRNLVTNKMVKMFENNGASPPSYTFRAVSPGGFNLAIVALWPKGVAVARIDTDEFPDVISCSLGKVSWHKTVAGPGVNIPTFTNHVVFTDTSGLSGTDFLSVAAADLNSDGRTDLVAANNTADEIWVWINEEDELDPEAITWTLLTAATGVLEPSMVVAADMNMDGHIDVVVADSEGDRLLWLQNDGGATPSFSTVQISATQDGIRSIAVVDIDMDGYPEIFSASTEDGRVVRWANGGGLAPQFTATVITDTLAGVYSIAVNDLDRDGDLDVAAGTKDPADPANSGSLVWFDSDGNDPPAYEQRAISIGGAVQSVTIGDVDGDGDGDLLSADDTDNALYVLENRLCSVGFPARFVASNRTFGADAVHAADLTGNGVPDIVSASFFINPGSVLPENPAGRRDITWFANDGNILPTLTEADTPIQAEGGRAQSVSSGDIDGDGDLDVLAASEAGNWIRWYENDGSGSPAFTQRTVKSLFFSARDAIAADVDGDGDMDVIGASSSENKVSWFENDGGLVPVFTEHVITRTALSAWSVYAADIDNDGDMDIASAAFADGRIAWYANDGNSPPTWTKQDVFSPEENERIPESHRSRIHRGCRSGSPSISSRRLGTADRDSRQAPLRFSPATWTATAISTW